MSHPETITITIVDSDRGAEACRLDFEVGPHTVVMRSESSTLGKSIWHGRDAFHALELMRKEIERDGWRALCNGARRDAYPSGMCRDMGRGFVLYPIPPEGPPNLNTFDPAPIEAVTTVEEQLANWNRWREAMKAQSAAPKPSFWERFKRNK